MLCSVKDKRILFAELGRSSKAPCHLMLAFFKFLLFARLQGWCILVSNSSGSMSDINTLDTDGSSALVMAMELRSNLKIIE